jgi:hypothetical protein
MPFPELFEWYDIAIKDNQSENQKLEAAQKKAEEQSKRRTR